MKKWERMNKMHHVPLWLKKKCRRLLKDKGEDSRDSAGCVIRRSFDLFSPRLSSVDDHYGAVKNGDGWNYFMQPYGHARLEIPSFRKWAEAVGIKIYADGSAAGPWHPETVYFEVGEA